LTCANSSTVKAFPSATFLPDRASLPYLMPLPRHWFLLPDLECLLPASTAPCTACQHLFIIYSSCISLPMHSLSIHYIFTVYSLSPTLAYSFPYPPISARPSPRFFLFSVLAFLLVEATFFTTKIHQYRLFVLVF
jgi:hypothetical protein